ncbi:hypothetical protein CLAFUW4_00211 [Fulvia fulva]|uniref:Glycosyl transferase CAP10 domain-containing protein n=1 Tax=Passalora fulva TaxID=5499 RepID=A0A9Q8P3G9_PASFU|nr:uncharacterized protein CLAFUR5_00211 [Fulvia fulva]KAK4636152.1 hypothetical protein CLAFUR4_00211 [Fulvia fulva]KAK4638164.1 hypothetical protein CLAFUR0_00212 [Fulvia fulva]UJO11687.1 hypothetical protein CLAFUR5_00211 [Fulvia fulva]WPV09525.1 hypothetical protein CLAFUW4_00211 [Fulvia fulva]WPV24423.1 hypothetical protein CLAFUW7_00214 [Fulvia fulva]
MAMDASCWRRKPVFVPLLVLALIVVLYSGRSSIETAAAAFKTPHNPKHEPTLPSTGTGFDQDDEYDSLTDRQCAEVFPDLYHEVDRAVEYWKKKKRHTVSADDVEVSWRKWDEEPMGDGSGGAMRILIVENELRILESEGMMGHWGHRGRAMGFLYLLQRSLHSAQAAGEKLPTIEAALIAEDIVNPPDGTKARYRAMERDSAFKDKIPKAVWRGSGFLNPGIREKLFDIFKDKDWSDVWFADYGGMDSDHFLTVEHMCKYMFAIHTEGVSYSGRLSYIQNCGNLPIIHDLEWDTYTTHLLRDSGPDQNYVRVKRDWTDLEEKIKHYIAHPEEAEKIIDKSLKTFRHRYLTRPALSCYVRNLIRGYSTVSFKPEVYRPKKKGSTARYRRGISFERFLDSPMDGKFEEDTWF